MKNLKIILTIFVTVIIMAYIVPTISLATSSNNGLNADDLIKFNGYTITKNTTIAQINSKFGTPKVEGKSAFGGKAYSYYDNNLTWYLNIETDESGKIKGFGAIGGNFVTKKYSYGGKESPYISYLSGSTMTDDSNNIIGIYEYNCSTQDVNNYWGRYKNDNSYLYDLQKHTIIVSKILAKLFGYSFTQTSIDEDLFYTNEQLKENGTDLYNYGINTGSAKYISLIMSRTLDFYTYLPNPIGIGEYSKNYTKAENYKYLFYDLDITSESPIKAKLTITFIDPNFSEETKSVALTEREQELLAKAKVAYNKLGESTEKANDFFEKNNNSYFDVEPEYDNMPITAGKMNDSVLQVSNDYLNVARVGMGLSEVKLNSSIVESAQAKATLVLYNSSHGLQGGHYPEKPSELSDDYYNKAQQYMVENLYNGNPQTSISNALNDTQGDSIGCGHRYNLLEPSNTQWGIGLAGEGLSMMIQSVHKFSPESNYNKVDLVAWPSNGIFPLNMVSNGIGNWTARFYNNYKVSAKTEVTIKCLNSGKIYNITQANKNESGKLLRAVDSKQLTFKDDTIAYRNGDVFEITIHNVDDGTGKLIDYTYRSVFKDLYSEDISPVTDINLNTASVNIQEGQTYKINAKTVPDNGGNSIITFNSDNKNIATIRQDGLITGIKEGGTNITVTCGDVTKIIKITITKKETPFPFKDVKEADWYYNSVKYCTDNKIIYGTTDTTFSPNNNLTRANLVTILWRMEGSKVEGNNQKFVDVTKNQYYYDAVNWAASKGIVNGYEDGKFRPNNNITREQLATILMNYAKYKGKDTRERTDLNKFVDNKGISSYAKDSISWAVAKNVMSGKVNGTRIDPAGTASRAEAAAMIANYCNYIGR